MSKKLTLLSEAIEQGFDPRDMFSYFTAEQFISFSNWVGGRHSFDQVKYYAWLNANYNLWHDPMPPMFAVDDMVEFTTILGEPSKLLPARINGVHIYRNEAKYDIELYLANNHKERLYNVPSVFLQRKSGDRADAHPEDYCQQCGGKNIVWSADNDLWNKVIGSPNGIICPQCFEKKAEESAVSVIFRAGRRTEMQKESNFTVRLKAHVEKCLKESGLPPYDLREEWRTKFFDRLGEGAVDALKVEGCVEKYIPKQNKES